MEFKFMKILKTDYTQGILATTKVQSKNARIEIIPSNFQKHNLVTPKPDGL
jgi:hypothetical protein